MAGLSEQIGSRDMSLPPTDELGWPEFEDYVEAVLSAHRFSIGDGIRITTVAKWGRPGDKQQGIDLNGEWSNGKTAIWQCKRYRRLSPAAVAKAVAACGIDADECYLVFSGVASPQALDKIAEYPGWKILDKRGLAQLLNDVPLQRQRQILDKTWGAATRKRILALPGADAFETIDRLAALRRSPAPLNDRGAFVGRADERRQLDLVLAAEDLKVVLITGSGGMGKSRLAVDSLAAFQEAHVTIPVISLLDGHDLQGGNLDELPHGPAVLLVDDGDDRLRAVEHLVQYAIRNAQTRLVITCRKHRAASVKDLLLRARLPASCIETIDVGPLTARQAREMVDNLAEGLNLTYPAKRAIARLTEEAPFLGVLSVNLIRSHDLTGNLSMSNGLRSQVLSGYRRTLTSAFAGYTSATIEHLLATCAALGPIDPTDVSLRSALASFAGLTEIELAKLLAALVDAEILRKADSGLRVSPDILADVLLEGASFSEELGIATGFVDQMWASFYAIRAGQLLRQLTSLNWRLQKRGFRSVVDGIWETIRDEIQLADLSGLCEAVEQVQSLSYTAPRELVSLLDDIRLRANIIASEPPSPGPHIDRGGLTHTEFGASERRQFGLRPVTVGDVMKGLAPLYAQCAKSDPDLFEQSLDGLWAIHQVLASSPSLRPTEEVRAAEDLLNLVTLASESFPARAVQRVRRWAETWPSDSPASPFFVLKPLLAKHGEETKQTAGRLITIVPYLVNATWARGHRDAIRDLLCGYARIADVALAAKAVDVLEHALQRPFAVGGFTPDAEQAAVWDADDLATIDVLRSASQETDSAVIRRLIRSALAWHALRGDAESRHAALCIVTELDNRDDDLVQVLLHSQGFGLRSRRGHAVPSVDELRKLHERRSEFTDDEYSDWEAERAGLTRSCVNRLWSGGSVAETLEVIEREVLSAMKAVGDRASLSDLGRCLAQERVDVCHATAVAIAEREPGILDELLLHTLGGWEKADRISILLWLKDLGGQRVGVRKAIGFALGAYSWLDHDRQFLAVVNEGRADSDAAVRAEFHRASYQLFVERPADTANSLVDEGIERVPATEILRSAGMRSPEGWIAALSANDIAAILRLTGRADVNDYGVEVLLANIAIRHPRVVLDFLTRISNAGAKLSHGPNRLIEGLSRHSGVTASWIVESAMTVEPMSVIGVITFLGKELLDSAVIAALYEAVPKLSVQQVTWVLDILGWCVDFWPLTYPQLARRILQRVRDAPTDEADAIRHHIQNHASRPMMISWSNGQSEEYDAALPLAAERAQTEKDLELQSIFEAALVEIRGEIEQLRVRHAEDED
jgi:hypothetical protein